MMRLAARGLLSAAVAAAACAVSPGSAVAQFTPFEAAIARFDAEVSSGVAEDAAGAVSVAVFSGDEIIWSKGWGWADIENRRPATAETIGRTGSISKSFTAVLMMQLVERGLVGLDEPVANHLPAVEGFAASPEGAPPITFRMLASHTAGLEREPSLEDAAAGSIYLWQDKVLASIPTTAFESPPGTEYSYSNIGFGTLGLALERAAGVSFMELMETLVFGPLGMESSTFILDAPDLFRRMSVGYSRRRDTGEVSAERATREHFGRGYKVPNGGIYSTVGDLARFAAAMMGTTEVQILTDASRREMLTPQAPAEGYGLGFSVEDEGGVTVVGHGGSVAGYNAALAFDPASGLGVALLRTTSYAPPVRELLVELVKADR
ncbi:MAG: serine hydrolase domain-containing protein [Longimicrobiales bacterium]|nr:serine hydrolase domain-containing protein [Longimicrobiales bacterium]